MNDMTFQILKIVVSICVSLFTVYILPYVYKLFENEKLKEIKNVVDISVSAAEQTIKDDGKGAAKKEMVLTFMQKWLSEHHINISTEQLDNLIEAAVYALNARR